MLNQSMNIDTKFDDKKLTLNHGNSLPKLHYIQSRENTIFNHQIMIHNFDEV